MPKKDFKIEYNVTVKKFSAALAHTPYLYNTVLNIPKSFKEIQGSAVLNIFSTITFVVSEYWCPPLCAKIL
jgi:hypothetical protein